MPEILVRKVWPKRQKIFNSDWFIDEIRGDMSAIIKPDVLEEFRKTTDGWEHSVEFRAILYTRTTELALNIVPTGPNAQLYHLVSRGSPIHNIPLSPGYLRFQPGYESATNPGSIKSKAKVRSGEHVVASQIIDHPGFEGRDFFNQIADRNRREFQRVVENAIRRAARRHGE